MDGPDIGMLPLANLRLLIDMLQTEHDEWDFKRKFGWYTQDTIFFSTGG
ncbi:hypothetical protein ACFYP4_10175 [Streptomyces sp. NPDC005551]